MKSLTCEHLLSIVILLICLPQTPFAQFGLPDSGVTVSRAANTNFVSGFNSVLSGGASATVWTAQDISGVRRAYVQIVSSDGHLIFPDAPPPLSRQEFHAFQATSWPSSDGGVIVQWSEMVGEAIFESRLQKLSVDGETLWSDGGIAIFQTAFLRVNNAEIFPSSDGGCFAVKPDDEGDRDRVKAIGSDGNTKPGWPEDGILLDEEANYPIVPDVWGGFWFVVGRNSFNRINGVGERVWNENIPTELPEGFDNWSGWKSNGRNFFLKLGADSFGDAGGGFSYVAVYDSSGDLIASDPILNRELIGDEMVNSDWIVTNSGKVYLEYGVTSFGGGDMAVPVEPPHFVLYQPFAEDRLPWPALGVTPVGEDPNNVEMFDLKMYALDDMLLFDIGNNLYAVNTDGGPAWEEPYIRFPIDEVWSSRSIASNGTDALWVTSGSERTGSWKVAPDGTLPLGEEPITLIPDQRVSMSHLSAWTTPNGGLNLVGVDKLRGLVGQSVSSEGEVTESMAGAVLIPDFPYFSQNWESGRVGDYFWVWQKLNHVSDGRLVLFNSGQEVVFDLAIDLGRDGNLSSSAPKIASNDRDQIVLNGTAGAAGIRFYAYNLQGQRTVNTTLRSPGQHTTLRLMKHWPNHGWVITTQREGGGVWVYLLNERLDPHLKSSAVTTHSVDAISFTDSTLFLGGLKYDSDSDIATGFRTTISLQGEEVVQTTDSMRLFDESVRNYEWSCVAGVDGAFWFLGHGGMNPSHNRMQKLNENWRRSLGSNGMIFAEGNSRSHDDTRLLSDGEGGIWVFYEVQGFGRVIHLDSRGLPWHRAYPAEGFALFGADSGGFADLVTDPGTGNIWVLGGKTLNYARNVYISSSRVQLVGDEWVGVKPDVPLIPGQLTLSAFPNPFNSSVTINFTQSPHAIAGGVGGVSLRIYDISGRLVADLLDGRGVLQYAPTAGQHKVVLDAGSVGAGVYFVRLRQGKINKTQKLVLIR